MRDFVARLHGRLRYGLAMQEILDRLARSGLIFYPYVVYQERADARLGPVSAPSSIQARQLTEQDVVQLAGIPERPRSETDIRERLARGNIGVGAFDKDSIIAYTWCDLDKLSGFGRGSVLRKLESDEACLADSYTLPAWRGRGIVLFLRSEVYGAMKAKGRYRLYSVCMYFNRSVRRLKVKVGAREVQLRLSIGLFGRFKRDLLLKHYPREGRVDPV